MFSFYEDWMRFIRDLDLSALSALDSMDVSFAARFQRIRMIPVCGPLCPMTCPYHARDQPV